jgi:MFS family permease
MCFMLGATSLLWGMTSRLFDRRSALIAAAIFAALGPTQALGALATYDAMALFLMAAAAWCVVAARDHPDSSLLVLAGAALLALANATKYMTVLFDPVIFALAALSVGARRGKKPGLGRGGFIAVSSIGVLAGLLGLGGSLYVHAVLYSTLTRANGVNSPLPIMTDSAKLIGICLLLAALAVVVASLAGQDRFQLAILAVLAGSALLVPLNQARIHTATSLFKHVDFGAWFAAAAAGYAVARLSHIVKWKPGQVIVAALALGAVVLPIGSVGRTQAGNFFQAWPNSSTVTKILRSVTRSHPGNILAEDYYVPAFYLEGSVPWQRWSDTWYFTYSRPNTTQPLTGLAAYRAAIDNHYFSLIILDYGDTASVDHALAGNIRRAGYKVIAEAPYWDRFGTGQFTVWAYQRPTTPPGRSSGQH